MNTSPSNSPSKAALYTGYALSLLPALLLLASAIAKFIKPAGFSDGMSHLGWPERLATPSGILEIACTLLYLFPPTAILGCILLTGYLGGAIATHVRVDDPFYLQAVLGIVLWLGLYLREPRLRRLIPLRTAVRP